MNKEVEEKKELTTTDMTANAVQVIKDAILQSQQKALKAVNPIMALGTIFQKIPEIRIGAKVLIRSFQRTN